MFNDTNMNDFRLNAGDIRQMESADEVTVFFADKLRYDITVRTRIPLESTTYANTQDLKMQISRHELIATASDDFDEIRVYLFEVQSVTAKLRNDLARGFRDTNDLNVLLVLTKDYDELEFVYLERSIRTTKRKGQPLKPTIRPIPLTVNRLKPDVVHVNVLNRFRFTEGDIQAQWRKLRSAYTLAEWSTPYFSNRRLFADHYLLERLKDSQDHPEWDENIKLIRRDLVAVTGLSGSTHSSKPLATIRDELYEPIFDLLGFMYRHQMAEEYPYTLLYTPDNPEQPIAAALTYVWDRNLDDIDETREPAENNGGSPFEVPGASAVSLMEQQIAPWVIVTNGKLWRLYSSTASNKATNYYEVNLEELLNHSTDRITAFKYWWLFFRKEAFTGFLDRVLEGSAKFAKDLGERLKDRVFVEIFPQFAKGFIADMRAQNVIEPDLDTVFSGTMTFLYRLMFILYAESLELLPVNEANGYRQLSLYRLKDEVARAGGDVEDTAPETLAAHYSDTSTDLYTRLKELFQVIDEGSDQMNMPTYNGGLFSTETDAGVFLSQYAIPDRYLAIGLDRLTRDPDEKTFALVFVDFKSLGVRQLGSIYEGLLEFKLKIAAEELAVTKSKGKEVYQPAKKVKKPLAVLEKGDVYLENDKQERKATGSYYTPDYIVKYIVEHTVGPVLDRKFDELRPRMREAQKAYRQARDYALKKGEDPEKFWALHDPRSKWSILVEDCLNIRVLDPAMGSGHFLVEVVDYISNRITDEFITKTAWGENPMRSYVSSIRQDIIDDLERQKVTIKYEQLDPLSLIRRAVLKRCVYGVDLNLMAVELAKVSLWLDAFTLGAPLSFLDHHLKHGNSLIGAMDLSDVVAVGSKRWEMILDAASDMVSLSQRTDSTVKQVDASKADYETARAKLEDVKKYANVPIASYFVDKLIEYRKSKKSNVIPQIAQIAYGTKQTDGLQELFDRAQTTADEKHFFHWKLEFPEVFIDIDRRDWAKDGGFDTVVGNPPYLRIQNLQKHQPTEVNFFGQHYKSSTGKYDIYVLFVEQSSALLTPLGRTGMIVPNKWIISDYGRGVREYLTNDSSLSQIVDFGELQIFDEASIYTCVLICSTSSNADFQYVKFESLDNIIANLQALNRNAQLQNEQMASDIIVHPTDESAWMLASRPSEQVILKITARWNTFESIFDRVFQGIITGGDSLFIFDILDQSEEHITVYSPDLNKEVQIETQIVHPFLRGSDIAKYGIYHPTTVIIHPYKLEAGRTVLYSEVELQSQFPKCWEYFSSVRHILENRGSESMEYPAWYALWNARDIRLLRGEKILVPTIADHPTFGLDSNGEYYTLGSGAGGPGVYGITIEDENVDIRYVLAILNSGITDRFVATTSSVFRGNYFAYSRQYIEQIPYRQIDFTTPTDERERLVQEITGAYDLGDIDGALSRVRAALAASQTDVVHDVLAHLAQTMIELNKQKQAEVGRFLGWLEDTLQIKPDKQGRTLATSLSGTRPVGRPFPNYLGDYQKGEYHYEFGENQPAGENFYHYLLKNKRRFVVSPETVLGDIQSQYEKSLEILLPIKDQLAQTDALIDKIVYRLYGLTDAEIELIERPGYEQALADTWTDVVEETQKKSQDEDSLDEDTAAAGTQKLVETVIPATERYTARVEISELMTVLRTDLPNWDQLPKQVQDLLISNEIMLQNQGLPTYTQVAGAYGSAVEVALNAAIFIPFRQQHTSSNCNNKFLQRFMNDTKTFSLGSIRIVLPSNSEPTLRTFLGQRYSKPEKFVEHIKGLLTEESVAKHRNQPQHGALRTYDEALQARAWAVDILGKV